MAEARERRTEDASILWTALAPTLLPPLSHARDVETMDISTVPEAELAANIRAVGVAQVIGTGEFSARTH